LGVGKQTHVEGNRTDKGGVYLKWTKQPNVEDLPQVDIYDLQEIFEEVRRHLEAKGVTLRAASGAKHLGDVSADRCEDERLEVILKLIPNNNEFLDRDKWVEIGHAIYGASNGGDKGKDLWVEWSNQVDQYPVDAPERFWDTIRPENVRAGASLLEAWAQKFNPAALAKLEFEPLPFEDKSDHLSKEWRQAIKRLRDAREEPGQEAFYGKSENEEGFYTFDFNETWERPLVRPDITDWHARGECSVLAAAPGTGKSTLSVLYAVAICLNMPELIGLKKIDWAGDIVIISNEDRLASIGRKLSAYREMLNIQPGQANHKIHLWNERLAMVSKTGALGLAPTRDAVRFIDRLADIRRQASICLVIIDTLASAVDGGDENSVGDMQALMNACGDIALAAFTAVELIHHVRKAVNDKDDAVSLNDMRGSSAIGGAVRAGVGIVKCGEKRRDEVGWTEDERRRTIRFDGVKANDRPLAMERFFRFEGINLQADDPRNKELQATVETGILRLIDTPKAIAPDWKTKAKDAIQIALASGEELALDKSTGSRITKNSAVKYVLDCEGGDIKKDRKAVHDAIAELVRDGVLRVEKRHDKNRNLQEVIVA
jgi:hypothetical protein